MIDVSTYDNINRVTGSQSQSETDAARSKLGSNLDDFLKLLTTQLKNQDPTAPADTNQLTQQIASLSQVEQQINTNKNLERLISIYSATQYNSVVSYIGKQIEASGNVAELANGEATFVYYLNKEATTANVTITDSTGATVYTGPALKASGRNEFVWDGKGSNGEPMPAGTYSIKVLAKDGAQEDIAVANFISGVVTSVDSANGSVYLSIGDISIPIEKVASIRLAPTTTNNNTNS
jgi:flagellar basal-body rod modification protein FlgD